MSNYGFHVGPKCEVGRCDYCVNKDDYKDKPVVRIIDNDNFYLCSLCFTVESKRVDSPVRGKTFEKEYQDRSWIN